ncbi:MAG: hypothetical protein ACOCQR_02035 [bacterium]
MNKRIQKGNHENRAEDKEAIKFDTILRILNGISSDIASYSIDNNKISSCFLRLNRRTKPCLDVLGVVYDDNKKTCDLLPLLIKIKEEKGYTLTYNGTFFYPLKSKEIASELYLALNDLVFAFNNLREREKNSKQKILINTEYVEMVVDNAMDVLEKIHEKKCIIRNVENVKQAP